MPWAATSDGTTLDGFHYEGLYVGGGLGSSLVIATGVGALAAFGMLVARGDAVKLVAIVCGLCGVGAIVIALAGASTINGLIAESGLFSSMSGGSVQSGVWISALGGVGMIVGAVLGAMAPARST